MEQFEVEDGPAVRRGSANGIPSIRARVWSFLLVSFLVPVRDFLAPFFCPVRRFLLRWVLVPRVLRPIAIVRAVACWVSGLYSFEEFNFGDDPVAGPFSFCYCCLFCFGWLAWSGWTSPSTNAAWWGRLFVDLLTFSISLILFCCSSFLSWTDLTTPWYRFLFWFSVVQLIIDLIFIGIYFIPGGVSLEQQQQHHQD